jgi:hypothetical protein
MHDTLKIRTVALVAGVAVAILFSAGLHPGALASGKGAQAKANSASQPATQARLPGQHKYNNIVLKRGMK